MTSRSAKVKYKLPDQADRAGYVERNFDDIAGRYDRFNDLATFGLHRLWKQKTLAAARAGRVGPIRLLDLCSGTGDLALLAARKLPQGSQVRAIDFSEGMLSVLRARAAAASLALDIQKGDATNLTSVADGSVDALMIGFGLRNVPDRSACLSECHRVLAKGGRLAILDVGRVSWPVVRLFHQFYFERVVPWIGYLVEGQKHEMYAYLPASARIYPGQAELAEELRLAGFGEVSFRNFLFGSAALHTASR